MVTLSREEEEDAVFRNINLADAARKLDVVTILNVLGDAFLNMTYADLMDHEELFPHINRHVPDCVAPRETLIALLLSRYCA